MKIFLTITALAVFIFFRFKMIDSDRKHYDKMSIDQKINYVLLDYLKTGLVYADNMAEWIEKNIDRFSDDDEVRNKAIEGLGF